MSTALSLSLLFHALLLSVALGGQAFGLPGLNFPWKERRLGANDLRILLAPAQPTAAASAPAPAPVPAFTSPTRANTVLAGVDQPAVGHSEVVAAAVLTPPPAPAPTPATAPAPLPVPAMTAGKRPDVNLPIAPDTPPMRAPANSEARNIPTQMSEVPVPGNTGDAAQKQVEQDTRERALAQARLEQEKQSAERLRQAELTADAQREAARQERLRQDAARAEQTARSEAARMEAERQELARQEGMRREAQRQERARQDEKAQQDAARQELERAEAARLEAGRREAARQEQTRQAQLEAARQAQTQLDAARQDAIKQEAARQDAVKQEAARQERARQEQAQRERAEQEEKREERLRAIGRQLDAEAAQRDALNRPSRSLLPTVSSLRRGWLFGRADPNTDLVLYAEAMSRKIGMNMTFDMVREAAKQPHTQPIVTVAIRADGSVEKVTFVVSSGVAAIDESIRKVVASQAPYAAFPPALARQYDVIEIRRTWIFDIAIRLQ